jgi:hypothetical protein
MEDILETRFGITLPHITGGPGLLSIDPAPSGRALVRILAEGAGDPYVAPGEFFAVPFDVDGHYRVELRCAGLVVTATRRPQDTLDVKLDWNWDKNEWTVEDWRVHARLRLLMLLEHSRLEGEVEHNGKMVRILDVPLGNGQNVSQRVLNHHRLMSEVAGQVAILSRAAGADQSQRLSADEFELSMAGAIPSLALARGASIGFDVTSATDDAEFPDRALVGGRFRLKSDFFAWYGVMNVRIQDGTPRRFLMESLSGISVRRTEDGQSFADFLALRRDEQSLTEAFDLEWTNGRAVVKQVVPNGETPTESM